MTWLGHFYVVNWFKNIWFQKIFNSILLRCFSIKLDFQNFFTSLCDQVITFWSLNWSLFTIILIERIFIFVWSVNQTPNHHIHYNSRQRPENDDVSVLENWIKNFMDPMDSQKCKLGRKGFDKLLCPSYYTYRTYV